MVLRFFLLSLLTWTVSGMAAAATDVRGVRLWESPEHTRVVLDLSGPVKHRISRLESPPRLVIDLESARLKNARSLNSLKKGIVKGVRSGKRKGGGLRMVLDLKQSVRPKSFMLHPNGEYGHRLVVDLASPGHTKKIVKHTVKKSRAGSRDIVIAIDAGHGGEDPGAKGKHGTREKVVVLAMARKLAKLVNKEPGMRAVLIRDGDYYIGLRNRVRKARKHNADLFVSIHADAFRDRRVSGSSVYAVSERGASNEMARWLAERENASDLAGGVSLDDKDDLLKTVLLDLSRAATIEASLDVGAQVARNLKRVGKRHKRSVQQAGFMVLKSPDIPSVLVETAFISNPAEERRLRDPAFQHRMASAILDGIRTYFGTHPPPGTRMASARHTIRRGDTLGGIARRYKVSVASLRTQNRLSGDRLRVGDVLTIPPASTGS